MVGVLLTYQIRYDVLTNADKNAWVPICYSYTYELLMTSFCPSINCCLENG